MLLVSTYVAPSAIARGDEITRDYHEFNPGFVGFLPVMAASILDPILNAPAALAEVREG
jgi:hypothetical protein